MKPSTYPTAKASESRRGDAGSHMTFLQQVMSPEAILEAAPVAIVVADAQGRVVMVNAHVEEKFGYTRSDLIGRSIDALLANRPGEPPLSAGVDIEATNPPGGSSRIVLGRRKDGREFPVDVGVSAVSMHGASYALFVVRDLTTQRAVEGRLQESERGLQDAQHVARMGSWEADPRTPFFRASPALFEIYGRPVESGDVLGQPFRDAAHPEDRVAAELAMAAAVAGKRPWEITYRIVRPDGGIRNVLSRGEAIEDASGTVVRIAGTLQDVTDRVVSQAELLRQRDLYEGFLQAASDLGQGVAILEDGRIVHANERIVEMIGYTAAELHALPDLQDVLTPGSRAEVAASLAAIDPAAARFSARGRAVLVHKDGRSVNVEYAARLLRTREHARVFITVVDVSERMRAAEAERGRNQRELELERLKELDAFRTRFINAAAHELRTPLTPIKLQLHIIKTDHAPFLGPQIRRSIEILDRNVERLHQLVQDVLDGSRLQSGRFGVARKPIDLSATIAEAVESFEAPARQAGVALAARIHRPLPVEADETRISQVLFNLLSNAIKFTSEGGSVDVEAKRDGNQVLIRIKDSGMGLTEEQIARLFVPFSRVHDLMASTVPGTGLGLYISKGIVDLHEGAILPTSEGLGKGATFTVRLPVTEKALVTGARSTRVHVGADTRRDALARRVRELI